MCDVCKIAGREHPSDPAKVPTLVAGPRGGPAAIIVCHDGSYEVLTTDPKVAFETRQTLAAAMDRAREEIKGLADSILSFGIAHAALAPLRAQLPPEEAPFPVKGPGSLLQ